MIDWIAEKRLDYLLAKEKRLQASIVLPMEHTGQPSRQHNDRLLELSWTQEKIRFWQAFLK